MTETKDEKRARLNEENGQKQLDEANSQEQVPNPLWQSATVSTDGTGPRVEDVTPIFDQARADALADPVVADDDDEKADAKDLKAAAKDAQKSADEKVTGYVAPTGKEAEKEEDENALPQAKRLNDNKKADTKK